MERRLILHEKLKGCKQKKMTIKQGEALVTLNLRTDIIDESREISDKVLFMLEAFADKNQKPIPVSNPIIESPKIIESEKVRTESGPLTIDTSLSPVKLVSNFKNRERQSISPSKRVRFDLDLETKVNDKPQENLEISNSSIKQIDNSLTSTPVNKESSNRSSNENSKNENSEIKMMTISGQKQIDNFFKSKDDNQRLEENKLNIAKVNLHKKLNEEEITIVKEKQSDSIIIDEPLFIQSEPKNNNLFPIFMNTSKTISDKSSSTNTSNNTLDELLDELDKTNSKLIQESNEELADEGPLNEPDQLNNYEDQSLVYGNQSLENEVVNNIISNNDISEDFNNLNESNSKVSKNTENQSPTKNNIRKKKMEESQDESQEVFKCRLCRLKLNNVRGLHEHVARIHGGKGGMFNSSLFPNSNMNDGFESNHEGFMENEDDSCSDIEQITSNNKFANNGQFKKKLHNDYMPHPNVAIRVAKIAYYNSKISSNSSTSSSNNAFKANIFTNGLRGNFFSQERLPLRSCKIKMKLKRTHDQSLEISENKNLDDFLTHTNNLVDFDSIDRNITVTTQSITTVKNEFLSNEEIRYFFKSLLVYIPVNNVMRLNDLIKSNEHLVIIKEDDDSIDYTESFKLIYEIILDSKQVGITLYSLKKKFDTKISLLSFKMLKFKELINLLIDNFLILSVGVVDRVYVAHQFKQHWIIQSFKNQKGRGHGLFDAEENISEDLTETKYSDKTMDTEEIESDQSNSIENNSISGRSSSRIKEKSIAQTNLTYSPQKSNKEQGYKVVCLIPRPWRYIDGLINRPILQKMLETIIIYLKTYPNSSLQSISDHFCPVLQPIMTRELLEMLENIRAVQKIVLTAENPCDLFSDFQNGSVELQDLDKASGNEIFTYCVIQNSIFMMKKLFH